MPELVAEKLVPMYWNILQDQNSALISLKRIATFLMSHYALKIIFENQLQGDKNCAVPLF